MTGALERLVRQILEDGHVEFAQLEARTKSIDSFSEKIARKGEKYLNPLNDIKDLVGLRVIVYYPDDVVAVGSLIEREFDVDWEHSVRQGADVDPDRFGYRSDHYVVLLAKKRRSLAEWKAFSKDCAEIQVRTVMQHAWAAVDHKIRYKGPELPSVVQRRLARLSALLEVADEQFASLQEANDAALGSYTASVEAGDLELALDALSLRAYLNNSGSAQQWQERAIEHGFMPPEHDVSSQERVEDLLGTLQRGGLTRLQEVDDLLSSADAWGDEVLRSVVQETKKAAEGTTQSGVIWAVLTDVLMILAASQLGDHDVLTAVRWRDDIGQGLSAVLDTDS